MGGDDGPGHQGDIAPRQVVGFQAPGGDSLLGAQARLRRHDLARTMTVGETLRNVIPSRSKC